MQVSQFQWCYTSVCVCVGDKTASKGLLLPVEDAVSLHKHKADESKL